MRSGIALERTMIPLHNPRKSALELVFLAAPNAIGMLKMTARKVPITAIHSVSNVSLIALLKDPKSGGSMYASKF
jgi:hypothetical protein